MKSMPTCDSPIRNATVSSAADYKNIINYASSGASWSSSYDVVLFVLQASHSSHTTSSDLNYPIASGFFKAQHIEVGEQVINNLNIALANEKAENFSQKEAASQAAAIFNSFRIKNILVQYTADDSVMFEFIESGFYFLLEIFSNGEIAYLRRKGHENPFAYDISQEDLYTTIESMYDTIVESNVQ